MQRSAEQIDLSNILECVLDAMACAADGLTVKLISKMTTKSDEQEENNEEPQKSNGKLAEGGKSAIRVLVLVDGNRIPEKLVRRNNGKATRLNGCNRDVVMKTQSIVQGEIIEMDGLLLLVVLVLLCCVLFE